MKHLKMRSLQCLKAPLCSCQEVTAMGEWMVAKSNQNDQ